MRATQPCVSHLAIWTSTFQAYYAVELNSKDVSLTGYTLNISSDLNHTGYGSHFTLFSNLVIQTNSLRAKVTLTQKAKSLVLQALEISTDPDPISNGVHLTTFEQPSHLVKFFLNSGEEFLWVGLSVCLSVCRKKIKKGLNLN